MGSDQSKDSSHNHKPVMPEKDCSDENNAASSEFDFPPMTDQTAAWDALRETSNEALEPESYVVPQVINAYCDVPFMLSPWLTVLLKQGQTSEQFLGSDSDYASMSRYDYDFSLERSVVEN